MRLMIDLEQSQTTKVTIMLMIDLRELKTTQYPMVPIMLMIDLYKLKKTTQHYSHVK